MSKIVSVRKTDRVVNPLSVAEMEQRSRGDLIRLVRRLYRQGLNSEQIKNWFVEGIPLALVVVGNPLPRRASRRHSVRAAGNTPALKAEE